MPIQCGSVQKKAQNLTDILHIELISDYAGKMCNCFEDKGRFKETFKMHFFPITVKPYHYSILFPKQLTHGLMFYVILYYISEDPIINHFKDI